MNTTSKFFSPSINIRRDLGKEIDYIPTSNAHSVFTQITNEYYLGIRAFSIIGAYGVGKSAFLWAFEKVINQERDYFPLNTSFLRRRGFKSINIVGSYRSITEAFASEFKIGENYSASDIFTAIDSFYYTHSDNLKGIAIYIDEFGKFLEYAANNNPSQELYFIQQLAEYVNDTDKEVILITTLHQDFNSYAFTLSKYQQNEWNKVKGRIKEIPFSEPVEQLLYLASERINNQNIEFNRDNNFAQLFKGIKAARVFPLRDYLDEDIAFKLLPLDILAAAILTKALQVYGQNERSLFSFLQANDHLGVAKFESNYPFYNLSLVYDYLLHNFQILRTKYNPHYSQWAAIRSAIERVEGVFEEESERVSSIVKAIGLLNIFSPKSAIVDHAFLTTYCKLALGIKDTKRLLGKLLDYKIIRFTKFNRKFILFEGTDLDIELAIDEAGNLVEQVHGIANYLNEYFEFPFILAKAAFFNYGTPRFFEFKITAKPIEIGEEEPIGEIDGFINLIFPEHFDPDELISSSRKSNNAILYGIYKNTKGIKELIFEIQKIKKVLENNNDDRIAKRELNMILEHQVNLLNHYVLGSIYNGQGNIDWIFQGKRVEFTNQKEFNRTLSNISEIVYHKTPIYRSELINKTKISSPISTANKSLIRALAIDWNKVDLGFPDDKFPPEKTIYLSLIKDTGILATDENGDINFSKPRAVSFLPLWETCEEFLDKSKAGKRNIWELFELLSRPPFKLKRGFIEFWIPIFLFAKREDYAIFEKSIYIPKVTDQLLFLVMKSPHKYYVKSFDITGINLSLFQKYRKLLNQKEREPSNQSFIETVRPFLVFYKALPEYTKSTLRLPTKAGKLRDAIAKAENPEKTFFEDFPSALGYRIKDLSQNWELLDSYIDDLQQNIKSVRIAFDELLNRFEQFIIEFLGLRSASFQEYKSTLVNRFQYLRTHLLNQRHKAFLQRVSSDLDRNNWLSSICHSCIGKSLEKISDNEEMILYDAFADLIVEIDNIVELSSQKFLDKNEDFISIELFSSNLGRQKQIVRFPGEKLLKVNKKKTEIEKILGKENDVNIAAILRILNELLDE